MSRITTLIVAICFLNFKSFAFEPYSGISCHNSIVKGKVDFFLNMMKTIYMQQHIKE